MAAMIPLKRSGGDQYLHHKSSEYRDAVRRKKDAYHRFIQVGLTAQGIMVAISTMSPALVWNSYGSWLRTVRAEQCPSAMIVSLALKTSSRNFSWLTGRAQNS